MTKHWEQLLQQKVPSSWLSDVVRSRILKRLCTSLSFKDGARLKPIWGLEWIHLAIVLSLVNTDQCFVRISLISYFIPHTSYHCIGIPCLFFGIPHTCNPPNAVRLPSCWPHLLGVVMNASLTVLTEVTSAADTMSVWDARTREDTRRRSQLVPFPLFR